MTPNLQRVMLYAANPLTNLWSDLIEQGLTRDPQAAILVSDILEVIQRTLVLLGNANNLISETRREVTLDSIHPPLKKYGKGEFSKAKSDFFGQDFKDGLVNSRSSNRALQKQPSGNRFFGSRTSRYGAVSGRLYQPYRSFQGKGKHATNRPY